MLYNFHCVGEEERVSDVNNIHTFFFFLSNIYRAIIIVDPSRFNSFKIPEKLLMEEKVARDDWME